MWQLWTHPGSATEGSREALCWRRREEREPVVADTLRRRRLMAALDRARSLGLLVSPAPLRTARSASRECSPPRRRAAATTSSVTYPHHHPLAPNRHTGACACIINAAFPHHCPLRKYESESRTPPKRTQWPVFRDMWYLRSILMKWSLTWQHLSVTLICLQTMCCGWHKQVIIL